MAASKALSTKDFNEALEKFNQATKNPGSLESRKLLEPSLSPPRADREVASAEVIACRSAKPLKKLTARQRQVVFLHLQGIKSSEIAAHVGYTEAWVSTILSDPLVQPILEQYGELARLEMLALRKEAVDVQRNSLRSKEEKNRLRASETILKATGMLDKEGDDDTSIRTLMKEALDRISEKSSQVSVRVIKEREGVEISYVE